MLDFAAPPLKIGGPPGRHAAGSAPVLPDPAWAVQHQSQGAEVGPRTPHHGPATKEHRREERAWPMARYG